MTVIDSGVSRAPRTGWIPRLHRRHEIVTTDGMAGVLRVGAALAGCGFAIRDFAAEVREGVPYSSITCTVSLTGGECDSFSARISAVPDVIAVTAC
ncbi:MAG: hypothetical protein L0H84_07460 [Pseudonocardia sp.]|nr:hypothetical protein [Pseudonocardia sp.]